MGPIERPTFDQAAAVAALDGVVARTKQLTGVDPPGVAFTTALGARLGSVQRRVLAGGRGLIQASTAANHASVGWRRVTDGNPCAFCAMLAGRGPVYDSAESADGFHNLCGCTVEEVFGDWVPSVEEERFRELYAASAGGTPEEVLARMRANGQGIINDAATPATQTGGSGGGAGKPPKRQTATDGDGPPQLPERVRIHILDGDSQGGGHRHGMIPGPRTKKRWFPEQWSDGQIIDAVLEVAVSPSHQQATEARVLHYGEVGGVRIKVWLSPDRREVTAAHPMDGDGVIQVSVAADLTVTLKSIPYGTGGVSW